MLAENNQEELEIKDCPDLKTGIMSTPFVLLFTLSMASAIFSLYLLLNLKPYGLTVVNNDYLITFFIFLSGVSTVIG